MNEFYSKREQMKQDISDEEIAENAGKFLQEGREVLLYTVPANTKAVVEQIEKSLAELRKL